jgi:hypothetical protein
MNLEEKGMDFLLMMKHPVVQQWLAQSMVIFFVLAGAALLVFGVSLIVNSAGALRIIGRLNQWVSMRPATKPLEIPRDTRPLVQKYRYGFAAVFILGAAFALYGLLFQFESLAAVRLLGLGAMAPDAAHWFVDSLRWLLILGNVLAIVAGILLAFFPARVEAIEARAGRWFSVRKATKGADDMRVRLDPLVEVYPRAVGVTVIVIGLALIATFGLMAQRVW